MEVYVLHVFTGKEKEAARHLETSILEELGENHKNRVVFPRRELMQRRQGRNFKKIQPLFPGYLFWMTKTPPHRLFRTMNALPHVLHFLPGRQDIKPLPREDIRRLQALLEGPALTPLINVSFDENNRIVIHDGPFKGLEGRIVKVDRRKHRMKVSLDLYGDGRLVDLGYRDAGKTS